MKISLAFLCPYNNRWIGGWDRKYSIYYKNLDEVCFEKYMIFVTSDVKNVMREWREVVLTEDMIENFCHEKGIESIYFGGGKVSKETEDVLLEKCIWLVNVNFTPIYTTDPRKLNLIISMTDYWKLVWMHGKLSNSFVVYNPVDVELWNKEREKTTGKYRASFTWKKHIIGRMARAEPSKWHWLILATLFSLDKKKNYDFGFLFAGLPWLYRKWINIFLSKQMKACIVEIPEQREHRDIAEFYASIDIFWQTSWIGESFGNVIAEAACFGVSTITDYKAFYKNGIVNPLLYDAQIELVDHEKTGIYTSTPQGVIKFLENTNKEKRDTFGKNAEKKVREEYAIGHTVKTLAKVLYQAWKERWIYHENIIFENIQESPNKKTIQAYEKEYWKRVALWEQFDTIPSFSRVIYSLSERLWRFIEYIYLAKRKFLKTYFSLDIEKF